MGVILDVPYLALRLCLTWRWCLTSTGLASIDLDEHWS